MSLLALLRLGLARGSRWRVIALFAGLAIPPSLLATLPILAFLSAQLDRAVGAEALAGAMNVPLALELMHALSEEQGSRSIALGLVAGVVLALVVAPWSAGAALAEGRAVEPMRIRGLLAAAGDLYGRLVRLVLVGALPLGVAALAASGLFAGAEASRAKALTEAAGRAPALWAGIGTAVLLFLAHLTLDAGRAHLAAEPVRRSAFLAWTAGAWLVIRRPVRTVALGLAGTALGLGGAFAAMAVRGRLPAGRGESVVLAFLLATIATAAIAWGRSIRLAALSELAALDAAERVRKRALRAARRASRGTPTAPLLPALEDPATHAPEVTAPVPIPSAPPPGDRTP